MGKSVDWNDILVRHGAERVRAHVLGDAAVNGGVGGGLAGEPARIIEEKERTRAKDRSAKRAVHRGDSVRSGPAAGSAEADGQDAADDVRGGMHDQGDDCGEHDGAGQTGVADGGEGVDGGGFDSRLSPDHMLVGYDLGGVPTYDDALAQGRLILKHELTHDILARKVLVRLFHPSIHPGDPVPRWGGRAGPDTAWLVSRYGGQWWVRPRRATSIQAWQSVEDEAFESDIGRCLTGFWHVKDKHNSIVPLAPTERMIKGVCRAMLNYVYVKAGEMPTWLEPSFLANGPNSGLPTWAPRVSYEPAPKLVGRHREVRSFIALQNGVLDVDALCDPEGARVVISPPTPRFFTSACLPYDVPKNELELIFGDDDVDADDAFARLCPSWIAFVRSCAAAACGEGTEQAANWERRAQEIAGYILSQWRELEVLFYFQGQRGTGKGTFCEGLQAMVGDAGVASMDADQLASRFGLAALMGRQMYLISELRFSSRFTNVPVFQDRLLKISSGDPVQVEEKMVSTVQTASVRLSGAFVLTLNQEPNWPDDSAAMVRRLVVMPFAKYQGNRDDGLKSRIAREAPGIFCWALKGLRRLRVERAKEAGVGGGPARFTPLVKADRMLREIEQNMSPMTQWAQECLVLGVGNETETELLREHFKAWAKSLGLSWLDEVSAADFGKKIAAALPGVERDDTVRRAGGKAYRVYLGVRPKLCKSENRIGGASMRMEEEWEYGGMQPRSVIARRMDYGACVQGCGEGCSQHVGYVSVLWPGVAEEEEAS